MTGSKLQETIIINDKEVKKGSQKNCQFSEKDKKSPVGKFVETRKRKTAEFLENTQVTSDDVSIC